MIEKGKTAKEAALLTGINIRTAQHYIKRYNNDGERRLPVSGRKLGTGRQAKLTEAHSRFLVDYVDEQPTAVLSDIRRNLCEAFRGLSISISALHRHLVEKCKLTLKKLQNYQLQEVVTVSSNSERKELKNGKRFQNWIMVGTAYISMWQDSISILNGIMAILEKGHQPRASCRRPKV